MITNEAINNEDAHVITNEAINNEDAHVITNEAFNRNSRFRRMWDLGGRNPNEKIMSDHVE